MWTQKVSLLNENLVLLSFSNNIHVTTQMCPPLCVSEATKIRQFLCYTGMTRQVWVCWSLAHFASSKSVRVGPLSKWQGCYSTLPLAHCLVGHKKHLIHWLFLAISTPFFFYLRRFNKISQSVTNVLASILYTSECKMHRFLFASFQHTHFMSRDIRVDQSFNSSFSTLNSETFSNWRLIRHFSIICCDADAETRTVFKLFCLLQYLTHTECCYSCSTAINYIL